MPETFQVNTPDFAGPMDLLVFFVRRRELDVSYISVGAIVSDYLNWLQGCELRDLDSAGDFILLAAILLHFKSSGLLPLPEPEIADMELAAASALGAPEEFLALKLSASHLAELEEHQINLFDRGRILLEGVDAELAGDMLSDVSLYDLAVVFRDLIYKLPTEPTHIIEGIPFTIEGQMAFIMSFFQQAQRVAFGRMAEALESRLGVIMTFLAMLELMRQGRIVVRQPEPFGRLWLIRREAGMETE